jgi:hypothetical protein
MHVPFHILHYLHCKISESLTNKLMQFIITDISLKGKFTVENVQLLYLQLFLRYQLLSCREHDSELIFFLSIYGMFHNKKDYLEGTVFLPDSCSVHC